MFMEQRVRTRAERDPEQPAIEQLRVFGGLAAHEPVGGLSVGHVQGPSGRGRQGHENVGRRQLTLVRHDAAQHGRLTGVDGVLDELEVDEQVRRGRVDVDGERRGVVGGVGIVAPGAYVGWCTPPGGVLEPGDVLTITTPVAYSSPGTLMLTTVATQTGAEASPGDESATDIVEVAPAEADLTVSGGSSTSEVTFGDTFTYLVAVTNEGPSTATNVALALDVPAGLHVLDARLGWLQRPCVAQGQTVSSAIPSIVAGGSNFAVVTVRSTTVGTATANAQATSDRVDPSPASASFVVESVAPSNASPVDLTLALDPTSAPVPTGSPYSLVYLVSTDGARVGTDVRLSVASDQIASGPEVVSGKIGWFGRPCAMGEGVTCDLGSVMPGRVQFMVLTVRPSAPGPFSLVATVGGHEPDPSPSSNQVVFDGTATGAAG